MPDWPARDLVAADGRLYLAGPFTKIGDTPRPGLAAINLGIKPGLASWNPVLPAGAPMPVAVEFTDRALYVGTEAGYEQYPPTRGIFVFPLIASAPTITVTATPTSSATATASPTSSVPRERRLYLPLLPR